MLSVAFLSFRYRNWEWSGGLIFGHILNLMCFHVLLKRGNCLMALITLNRFINLMALKNMMLKVYWLAECFVVFWICNGKFSQGYSTHGTLQIHVVHVCVFQCPTGIWRISHKGCKEMTFHLCCFWICSLSFNFVIDLLLHMTHSLFLNI